MKSINAAKLVKIHGFVLARQKGSHMIWKNLKTNTIVPVPLHGKSKSIPVGTLLAIVKQSKIPKSNFC